MDRAQRQIIIQTPPELRSGSPFLNMGAAGEGNYASTLGSETRDPETDQGLTLPPKIQSHSLRRDTAATPISEDLGALLGQAEFDFGSEVYQRREESWVHDLVCEDDHFPDSAPKRRRLTVEPTQLRKPLIGNTISENVSDISPLDSIALKCTPGKTVTHSRRDSGYGLSISGNACEIGRTEDPALLTLTQNQCIAHQITDVVKPIRKSPQTPSSGDDPPLGVSDGEITSNPYFGDYRVSIQPSIDRRAPSATGKPYLSLDPNVPISSIETPVIQPAKNIKIPKWMRNLSTPPKCSGCGSSCRICSDSDARKWMQSEIRSDVGAGGYWSGQTSQGSDTSNSLNRAHHNYQQVSQCNQQSDQGFLETHRTKTFKKLIGCFPVTSFLAATGAYDQKRQVAQLVSEGLGYFEDETAFANFQIPAPLQASLDVLFDKFKSQEKIRIAMVKFLVEKLLLISGKHEPNSHDYSLSGKGAEESIQTPPLDAMADIEADVSAEIDRLVSLEEAKALLRKVYAEYSANVKDNAIEIEILHNPSKLQTAYIEKIGEIEELKDKLENLERQLRLATEKVHEATSSSILRSTSESYLDHFQTSIDQSVARYEKFIQENQPGNTRSIEKPFWICSCGGLNDSIYLKSALFGTLQVRRTCMTCGTPNFRRQVKYVDRQEAFQIGWFVKHKTMTEVTTSPKELATPRISPQVQQSQFRLTLPSIGNQQASSFEPADNLMITNPGQENLSGTEDLDSLFDESETLQPQFQVHGHCVQLSPFESDSDTMIHRDFGAATSTSLNCHSGQGRRVSVNIHQGHNSYQGHRTALNISQSHNDQAHTFQITDHRLGQAVAINGFQSQHSDLKQGEIWNDTQFSVQGVTVNAPHIPSVSLRPATSTSMLSNLHKYETASTIPGQSALTGIDAQLKTKQPILSPQIHESTKPKNPHPGFNISKNTAFTLRHELGGKQRDWMTPQSSVSVVKIDLTNDDATVEVDDGDIEADIEAAFNNVETQESEQRIEFEEEDERASLWSEEE